jgi:hypothetical protein
MSLSKKAAINSLQVRRSDSDKSSNKPARLRESRHEVKGQPITLVVTSRMNDCLRASWRGGNIKCVVYLGRVGNYLLLQLRGRA